MKRERERDRGGSLRYWRTRSPQDVIAEQTEGPRTISINKIYAPRTQSASSSSSSGSFRRPRGDSLLSSLFLLSLLSRRCLVSTPPSSCAFYPMSKWEEEGETGMKRRERGACDSSSIFPRLMVAREELTRAQLPPFLGR